MGDRANVVVLDSDDLKGKTGVFLYSHWGGSELPSTLKEALDRKQRWNDAPYLARIIFQQMVGDDDGETGYGISASLTDNEYPLLVVDTTRGVVVEYPEDVWKEHGWSKLSEYLVVPFADYVGEWLEAAE